MNHSADKYLSRITGKLLGDGCITKQAGRKPRFQFIHRSEDGAWSWYCYESLKNFLPLNPPKYKQATDFRLKQGFSESYIVQSKTAPIITHLEELWYTNRQKQLPFQFITHYLDEEALAWWYQDDGHLKRKGSIVQKIILSTDSFSNLENTFLQQVLQDKFELSFKLDGQNRLLLYDQPQIYYFLKLVEPYIHPCMSRKTAPKQEDLSLIGEPKRTTISLPKQFLFQKPTQEINQAFYFTHEIISKLEDRQSFFDFFRLAKYSLLSYDEFNNYQITVNAENRINLSKIKQLTGWNQSQVTLLCLKERL
ncbi:hypothetical protein [Pseudobacillus badius]|uniref:hypothetical protein n=1 Tax=Bacillus badius TaxID=1455 RepID=UPI0007B32225|nr:hypothetical protein [Bacillus badius]KZR59870.1 hypothetical protein A3781_10300 [Bacillus badius]